MHHGVYVWCSIQYWRIEQLPMTPDQRRPMHRRCQVCDDEWHPTTKSAPSRLSQASCGALRSAQPTATPHIFITQDFYNVSVTLTVMFMDIIVSSVMFSKVLCTWCSLRTTGVPELVRRGLLWVWELFKRSLNWTAWNDLNVTCIDPVGSFKTALKSHFHFVD